MNPTQQNKMFSLLILTLDVGPFVGKTHM